MQKLPTSKPSLRREPTGIARLYKRTGITKTSFIYLYPDGRGETLASAPRGDRSAIARAELIAKRRALDIQAGQIVVGSIADLIDRFLSEIDPVHYRDQSKHGVDVRKLRYANLQKFFGKMAPRSLKMVHGYQYLDARAKAGAPASANKDIAAMQTICHYAIRWGVIEANPFIGLLLNKTETRTRTVTPRQVIRFYLWAVKQDLPFKTMGCAALFAYLTGFRAAEVRPFDMNWIKKEGVLVESAKRKKGEKAVFKLREWSSRLRTVVARAQQNRRFFGSALFGNKKGLAYTRSGWGAVWQDAMQAWIKVEAEKVSQPENQIKETLYFTLNDGRPTAITKKLKRRDADVYDFAAHANPTTTHKHYDRRQVKKAAATN